MIASKAKFKLGKKVGMLAISAIAALSLGLYGCASPATAPDGQDSAKKNVVAVSFPEYSWAGEIIGDASQNINLELIMNTGVDPHSFQASAQDVTKIATADVVIYTGGHSYSWVDDALANATNPNMIVVNMMDVLDHELLAEAPISNNVVDGQAAAEGSDPHSHEHGHDHEHGRDHDHDHATEEVHSHDHATEEVHSHDHATEEGAHDHAHDHDHAHSHGHAHGDNLESHNHADEHVWLSPHRAIHVSEAISDALATVSPENATAFSANTKAYTQELHELEESYVKVVAQSPRDTVVIADRFPLRYLFDDLNLKYYAAFDGCTVDSEASFETIASLAEKSKELDLKTMLIVGESSQDLAQSVIKTSGLEGVSVELFNPIEGVAQEQIASGTTYLSIMNSNLDVLKTALS